MLKPLFFLFNNTRIRQTIKEGKPCLNYKVNFTWYKFAGNNNIAKHYNIQQEKQIPSS